MAGLGLRSVASHVTVMQALRRAPPQAGEQPERSKQGACRALRATYQRSQHSHILADNLCHGPLDYFSSKIATSALSVSATYITHKQWRRVQEIANGKLGKDGKGQHHIITIVRLALGALGESTSLRAVSSQSAFPDEPGSERHLHLETRSGLKVVPASSHYKYWQTRKQFIP